MALLGSTRQDHIQQVLRGDLNVKDRILSVSK